MLFQQNICEKKQARLCSCLWAASTSACYSRVTGPHCWIKHQVQIDSPNMEVWPSWTASVSKDHGCRSLALPSPCDRACCRWVHESSTPTIDAWPCGTVQARLTALLSKLSSQRAQHLWAKNPQAAVPEQSLLLWVFEYVVLGPGFAMP